MNQYCNLSACISKNLRRLNKQEKEYYGVTHDRFHVFTIFKCNYNVGVTIIIYLFDVV